MNSTQSVVNATSEDTGMFLWDLVTTIGSKKSSSPQARSVKYNWLLLTSEASRQVGGGWKTLCCRACLVVCSYIYIYIYRCVPFVHNQESARKILWT